MNFIIMNKKPVASITGTKIGGILNQIEMLQYL